MDLFNKMFFMAMTIAITIITNLINIVLIARSLGVEDFGLFTYYFTLSLLSMIILNYGYPISLPKYIASSPNNAKKLFEESLALKLFIFIPLFTIATIHAVISHQYILVLLFLSLSLFSFAMHFNLLNRGMEKFSLETKNTLSGNIIFVILVLIVYFYSPSVSNYALAYLVSRLILFIIVIKQIKKIMPNIKLLLLKKTQYFHLLKQNITYTIDTISTSAFGIIDVLLVKFLFGISSVGLYQAGMKFVSGTLPLMQVISNVFIPRISKNGGDKYEQTLLMISIFTATIVSITFYLVFDYAVLYLLGESYKSLLAMSSLFAWIVFLKFASAGFGILVITRNLQKERTKINIIALLFFIALSFLLSNSFELNAIIYSYLVSIVYVLISYFFLLRKSHVSGINAYITAVILLMTISIVWEEGAKC